METGIGSVVRVTVLPDRGQVGVVCDEHAGLIAVVTAGRGMDWYRANELAEPGDLDENDEANLAEIREADGR